MSVQRIIRLAASAAALMTLPLVLACGDDDGTGTTAGLVGTWQVTSIMLDEMEILAGTSLTMTLTLRSNDTYRISVSGDTDNYFCDGTTSCTEDGTYVHTSTTFTLCDPGCDEAGTYTISGNTLTYVLDDPDTGFVWTLTAVRI